MTNSIYGIQNIKIKFFSGLESTVAFDTAEFIKKHNGDILDIQHQVVSTYLVSVMVVYTEKDNERGEENAR